MSLSEKIIPYINDINRNKLISIEDIVTFFDDSYFDDCSALIISGYGDRKTILPSLSFYFSKTNYFKYRVFESTKDIYSYIHRKFKGSSNVNGKNIFELFEMISSQKNSLFVKYFEESQVLILSYSENIFKLSEFETIITFLFLAKRNSLNLLNSSYTFTLADLSEIEKCFSRSIGETINGFKHFFETQYQEMEAFICFKDYENGKWVIKEAGENISVKTISKSIKLAVEYEKPIYQRSRNNFFLLLPFLNDKKNYILKYVLVLKSSNRIPRYIVTNYIKFTNNYFNAFLEKEKGICLNDLQSKIIQIQSRQRFLDTDFDAIDELKAFAKDALNSIVQLTNSFSATLWLYNPNGRCLELTAENEPLENLNYIREENTRSIPLSTYKSINVQTFKTTSSLTKDQYILITDTKKRGLRLHDSNSELCFPFYFKNVKIGVVNFESADRKGFDKDSIQYCKNMRNLLQSFYIQSLEINDKVWLSRRTQIYQNYHEIENVINLPEFPSKFKDELNRLIEQQQISLDDKYDTLDRLLIFKEDFFAKIRDITPIEIYNMFYQNVFIKIDKEIIRIKFRKFVVDSLVIILKNILSNQRNYAENDRDQLNVLITKDIIHFNINSSRPLLSPENKRYLISPFETVQNELKKTHYGLFTIGMLARQLGGYSNIFFNWKKSKTYLRILIPLQKSWMQIQSE
jgi:hypothetical protein